MKHAGEEALDRLADLLVQIRHYSALKEKKRGIFYWKSKAFLHFHEERELLYADLQTGLGWERFSVNTRSDWENLLTQLEAVLGKLP
jgi:hypothetical protein